MTDTSRFIRARLIAGGLAVLMILTLTACGGPTIGPTIDTTDMETLVKSFAAARDELPQERRDLFDEAIVLVAFKDSVTPKDYLWRIVNSPKICELLNGKTAERLIAEAEAIKQEVKERELREKEASRKRGN